MKMDSFDITGVKEKIVRLKSSYREIYSIAYDIETVKGKPYTIQFFDGNTTEYHHDIKPEHTTDIFLEYLRSHYHAGLTVWAFNLAHDLPLTFYSMMKHFSEIDIWLEYSLNGWKARLHACCARHWFGNGTISQERTFKIRDAAAFVPGMSLDTACEKLHLPVKKLPKPDDLGLKKIPRAIMEPYAVRDAVATWHLSQWILDYHKEHDVPLGVSAADLAGKVFRKRFLKRGVSIIVPPSKVLHAAMKAYHGGKTEAYLPTPCLVKGVKEYDINSAYPDAMSKLPNPLGGKYYEVNRFESPVGVYRVRGFTDCSYTALYTDDFVPIRGQVDTWATGYEIASALKTGCLTITAIDGFVFEPSSFQEHPFSNYVEYFHALKQNAPSEPLRFFVKILLNSLYGKLIARVPLERKVNGKIERRWRAGSLFHPFWGALTTGYVRARLHTDSHAYHPVCVSTDSLMLRNGVAPQTGGALGQYTAKENGQGDLVLLRNKLYLVLDPKDHTILKKWAGHGYQGRSQKHGLELLELYRTRSTKYTRTKMLKLREALRSKDEDVVPFTMIQKKYSISINWKNYLEF